MRSLVTGGAGFIGSHVAGHCLKLGHDVIVLDDLSGGFKENVPAALTSSKGASPTPNSSARSSRLIASITCTIWPPMRRRGCRISFAASATPNNVIGSVNVINEAVRHEVRCLRFQWTSSNYPEWKIGTG